MPQHYCEKCGGALSDDGKAEFYTADFQPELSYRSRVTASALALFLGTFGVHRFYLGEWRKGFFYLVFWWTWIPFAFAMVDLIRYIFLTQERWNERHNPGLPNIKEHEGVLKLFALMQMCVLLILVGIFGFLPVLKKGIESGEIEIPEAVKEIIDEDTRKMLEKEFPLALEAIERHEQELEQQNQKSVSEVEPTNPEAIIEPIDAEDEIESSDADKSAEMQSQ